MITLARHISRLAIALLLMTLLAPAAQAHAPGPMLRADLCGHGAVLLAPGFMGLALDVASLDEQPDSRDPDRSCNEALLSGRISGDSVQAWAPLFPEAHTALPRQIGLAAAASRAPPRS